MKILCDNFKIQNIVEGNCKTLCIRILFIFVMSIYLIYLLFKILYNLCFILNPLENNLGAATVCIYIYIYSYIYTYKDRER